MAITAAAIEPNGWVLRLTLAAAPGGFASYVFDVDGTPRMTLASSHAGFVKSGGQAVAGTLARTLWGTRPLRLPVNPASPTAQVIDEVDLGGGAIQVRIALTEHVYATDTGLSLSVLAGWRAGEAAAADIAVTNDSTTAAPIPIMRWALLPYGTTGGAFTLALFVASHHPVGLEPVAGVRFTATDGTRVKSVWTTQLSTDTSLGDGLRCYTAVIDPAAATGLTAGLLRCDAEVYPWLGAMRTTDPAGTRAMTTLRTDGYGVAAESPWVIGHDPAGTRYGSQFAFVDPVNGTAVATAAMVQPTLAAARALAPAARPATINTAIQAGYLANRTLPAANGQAAQARSIDGLQIVLAAGTHMGSGTTAVTTGIAAAEIPLRIGGDPADADPRANVVIRTTANAPQRMSRILWRNLSVEQGGNTLGANVYNLVDNVTFRGKAGLEGNNVAPFSSTAPAGQWNFAMVRSKWWRTGASVASGNQRTGMVRACEIGRTINGALLAARNRLIPLSEDGFGTAYPMFGGQASATLPGQVEDIVIAFNDLRGLSAGAWSPAALPAATAGTPNPSYRRQLFIGNVVERIGTDPAPFYGVGENNLATMSYNIIEANSFIGDRANTFYSDPSPTTPAEADSQRNQAFVNRIANNVFDWLPTKHDDFNDSQTAAVRGSSDGYRPQMVEAWSMLYGVGHEGNVDTRRATAANPGLFQLQFAGPRSLTGYGGALSPDFADDRSLLGSGGGGGDYRPLPGSPLAARGVRGNVDTDAGGVPLPAPFTAGAYQPAAVTAAALSPASARHGLSGAAAIGWTAQIGPAAAAMPQRAAAALTTRTFALAPADAGSPHAAGAPALALAIALLPAPARQPLRSGTPVLATGLVRVLAPDRAAHGLRPTPARLFAGGAAADAVLIVGSDTRTLVPNRH
ncbi:hypothetical protein [Polymorphobacter fuscus]|uniref:Uncharacterized protein n=1 Tax=Sandarakinorhabdus fusca TaxID=1439888 RepID=A0A7C9GMS5_9SPHN|nr:hypothetical protein [Polymorphobacter fuscus]KAB7648178.1 hypothetical protein F9290_00150 [Polymorphobacter fuscus]MQT15676.1 hypothetical protein [Polymorphobacter fuscus]NJC08053.1 hypothetical protein [Polymorphobacter fuscus]